MVVVSKGARRLNGFDMKFEAECLFALRESKR